jgi:hypothetical protein
LDAELFFGAGNRSRVDFKVYLFNMVRRWTGIERLGGLGCRDVLHTVRERRHGGDRLYFWLLRDILGWIQQLSSLTRRSHCVVHV